MSGRRCWSWIAGRAARVHPLVLVLRLGGSNPRAGGGRRIQ
ncbi:hypothetical protein [Sorangium sp. So ce542]